MGTAIFRDIDTGPWLAIEHFTPENLLAGGILEHLLWPWEQPHPEARSQRGGPWAPVRFNYCDGPCRPRFPMSVYPYNYWWRCTVCGRDFAGPKPDVLLLWAQEASDGH